MMIVARSTFDLSVFYLSRFPLVASVVGFETSKS